MSVSAASRADPASRPAARASRDAATSPEDVRAMKEAFAAARREAPASQPRQAQAGKAGGEHAATATAGDSAEAQLADLDVQHQVVADDGRGEDQGGSQGWAFGQALAAAPTVVPNAPSPLVDAGAFAQLLGQLWAQARQKDEREVRVRFGSSAWPATGARLVRNAAGSLDIAIEMAAGQSADLVSLGARLAGSGLAVDTLAMEERPG